MAWCCIALPQRIFEAPSKRDCHPINRISTRAVHPALAHFHTTLSRSILVNHVLSSYVKSCRNDYDSSREISEEHQSFHDTPFSIHPKVSIMLYTKSTDKHNGNSASKRSHGASTAAAAAAAAAARRNEKKSNDVANAEEGGFIFISSVKGSKCKVSAFL